MNDVASNSFRNSHLCFVFCAYHVKEGINNISPPPRFFFFFFFSLPASVAHDEGSSLTHYLDSSRKLKGQVTRKVQIDSNQPFSECMRSEEIHS